MNIVKFNERKISSLLGLTPEEVDIYNDSFRGKYCYAINMDRVYMMCPAGEEDNIYGVRPQDYINYERGILPSHPVISLPFKPLESLIVGDDIFAPHIPSPTDLMEKRNAEFEQRKDIPIDDLRRFRMIISLLMINGVNNGCLPEIRTCPRKMEMLKYYVEDMNNDTVTILGAFEKGASEDLISLSPTTTSSCGCSSQHHVEISLPGYNTCNAVDRYRMLIKSYMLDTFSDIEFWKYIRDNYSIVIERIIDYIDGIRHSNLSIFRHTSPLDLNYTCATISYDKEGKFKSDLENISNAFRLILNKDYSRLSLINSGIADFAAYFEYLSWSGYVVDFEENYI